MFHPVGSEPPSVYWRRRLVVIGSAVLVLVLLAVTVHAVTSGGGGTPAGAGTPSHSATPTTTSAAPSPTRSTKRTASSASTKPGSPSASRSSSSAAPVACRAKNLAVVAVVAKPSYKVGDEPMVELQVTNTGAAPCVQDLGDPQIVLKIYNGESRVWGSHDCGIQPGKVNRTLAVNQAVRVAITWTGLSSQPKCAGTRQRVGAGTYTLYASLAGKTGKAAQFSIS